MVLVGKDCCRQVRPPPLGAIAVGAARMPIVIHLGKTDEMRGRSRDQFCSSATSCPSVLSPTFWSPVLHLLGDHEECGTRHTVGSATSTQWALTYSMAIHRRLHLPGR